MQCIAAKHIGILDVTRCMRRASARLADAFQKTPLLGVVAHAQCKADKCPVDVNFFGTAVVDNSGVQGLLAFKAFQGRAGKGDNAVAVDIDDNVTHGRQYGSWGGDIK